MNSRILHLFTGLFLLAAFVQCNDAPMTPTTDKEKTEPPTNLTKPTLSTPEDGAQEETSVVLAWEAVPGAESYEVQLSTSEDFSSPLVDGSVDSTQLPVEALPADSSVYWKVRPVVQESTGPWSNIRNFTTEAASGEAQVLSAKPQSPSNEATGQAFNVNVQWSAIAVASGYHLQIATDEGFTSLVVDQQVNSNSFQNEGLSAEQTYYWRIEPVVDGQNTEWSEIFSFTTKAAEEQNDDEQPSNDDEPTAPAPKGFVSVSNGDFVLNGEVFRFAGTNAYHLPTYEKADPSVVNRAMDGFQEAGVKVVRTWGFYDGPPQYNNDITLQPEAGVYSEENLRHLDRLIAKGKEHGVRFIFALTNYWHELGGMPQYNAWDGNPNGGMQHFMNDPDTQKWFKDYISMLLNRTNTVTGVKYKNEPAIFAWEIMNEGRNPDSSNPQELANWYQDIAQYIKSIDPNHMVSTGEEGFDYGMPEVYSEEEYSNTYVLRAKEGTSYLANTSIPEIDYGTAHWYPSRWISRTNESDVIRAQRAFMKDHAKIAEDLGKPFVVGEYGFEGWGNQNGLQLNIYNDMWSFNEDIQVDGSLIWQLAADYVKCSEYGGNICWPGGRKDAEMYNSFKSHIEAMSNSK